MKSSILQLPLLLAAAGICLSASEPILYGTRIYVHPMDGLGSYIYNAFRVKGVPVELVGRREAAELELTGNEETEDGVRKRRFRLPIWPNGDEKRVAVLRLQKVTTGEVLFTKTYSTSENNNGRRGGAEACAADLELRIRQEGMKRFNTAPPEPVATVKVVSQPGEADIEVDGSYFGVTPSVEVTRLKPGPHVIVVKKYGYQRWERKVELVAGEKQIVTAELEAAAVVPGKARISGLE